MKISVLDNFYTDPNAVINLLSGDYPITGCGTGKRSIDLSQIDTNLFNNFRDAIFNIHGLDGDKVNLDTFFMEHSYNPIDIFNYGWVHIDGKNPDVCRMTVENYDLVLCGQIFLTPDPDPETGVSMYNLKHTVNWSLSELYDKTINNYTLSREKYEANQISLEQYEIEHKEYHDNFEKVHFVENVFNRMVSWTGGSLHGAKMTKLMPNRLNQYFFVSVKRIGV